MRWSEESIAKLSSAGEETLSTMLELRDDYDVEKTPRLVVIARRSPYYGDGVFGRIFGGEHRRSDLYMSEQAEAPDVSELSFRLLRHYASSVRHRKYHGIDIVTVQVDA